MAHTTERFGDHPVIAALGAIESALDETARSSVWSLDDAATRTAILQATRVVTRLAELEARLLTHATTVEAGESAGATSTKTWLAHATKQTHLEAGRKTHLARELETHPLTCGAVARGEVLVEQARVIVRAVEELPEDAVVREQCEKHLIVQAEQFDAKQLRILGRRVLEVVDPEAAEAHEAKLLDDAERRAAKAASFSVRRDGSGIVRGTFAISELRAAMLENALRALAAPKHVRAEHGAGAYDHERPSAHRLGQAFEEYLERYPTASIPDSGGISATVVVTLDWKTLLGATKAASLDNGEQISPATARRLACEAGIVPMVLGTGPVVLDQGRRARLHTGAQRLALTVTQRHCQAAGCDVPAAMCHVHHTTPWSHGGTTDLANAHLLCPRHHSQTHRAPPVPHHRT